MLFYFTMILNVEPNQPPHQAGPCIHHRLFWVYTTQRVYHKRRAIHHALQLLLTVSHEPHLCIHKCHTPFIVISEQFVLWRARPV